MIKDRFILSPNAKWPVCKAPIPEVAVFVIPLADRLQVRWEVHEGAHTYRCEVKEDGGPCWQDSCVEIFVLALDGSGAYVNFEFNPRGVCLAAKGSSRLLRIPFGKNEYSRILRRPSIKGTQQNTSAFQSWYLEVDIPADLLGTPVSTDLRNVDIYGNLYKCGDKSEMPHWLSAFPIDTPKPDYHRPEFFQKLTA